MVPIPVDVAPDQPSFITGVCSSHGPIWTGLQKLVRGEAAQAGVRRCSFRHDGSSAASSHPGPVGVAERAGAPDANAGSAATNVPTIRFMAGARLARR